MKENWMKDPRVQKAQEIFKGELKIIGPVNNGKN